LTGTSDRTVAVLDGASPPRVSSRRFDGPEGSMPTAHGEMAMRSSSGWRVLIVDGHADAAESMRLLLQACGYRVDVAAGAATALRLVESTEFDAAFLAINLPDLDGYALAGRLRRLGRPRVIVALTGHGSEEDRRRALQAGFDDHILKPASVDQLDIVLA